MRVIISHDVDHLSVWEHKRDLIVPKFIVRSILEWGTGIISYSTIINRVKDLLHNKWNGINELIDFDKSNGVKSTFFFGVNNGLGLSYSLEQTEYWIKKVILSGLEVGVHGIEYNDIKKMQEEYNRFQKISGLSEFGIRMHYLRKNSNTIAKLGKIGYMYDTTEYNQSPTDYHSIGDMIEFPLNIMEGNIFYGKSRYQRYNYIQAVESTKRIINEFVAINNEKCVLNMLFHPLYFSDSWPDWKKWYIWFIEYCRQNKMEFVSYGGLSNEVKSSRSRFI